ncbi:microtubule-associated protein TORTIFOLIA1 [Thalictrum thalictroides]|uniref:Microtubule-associated protein TORTIFOLIA1 n=1 Tax=Thalictrum thalictroides TaxID=46969 RepID=A0A7J6VI60_THATH|nr:microtubule-associated protein TORTIFOLIA1 [Thalictrum thalictroides]
MKTVRHSKGKVGGGTRVNTQQGIFELKQRILFGLNKLADRDTYQIGVEELEKIAQGLTLDGISPFISCIVDTDSAQKSAVRKECIRLMGTLVRFHEGLLSPYLGKMMASIAKRLKDPDSVVRDACVEVVGVFSSKLSGSSDENDGAFVVIVKTLFEALGEQNKHVQSGSALCLASVIDNAINPVASVLSRMLTRITKFLKNPHFMAKPAVIELIRSIIQAGGAPTQTALSAAVRNIEECLKNSDWITRKAASVALASIAMSGSSLLYSVKASCVHSLESCRFDKVKPVRDSVLQALQCWKTLPGSDSCEPSEAGSSTKENFFGGDYNDPTSDGGWKDSGCKKGATSSLKHRISLTSRKASANPVQGTPSSKRNDWPIEIAVPKTCTVSSEYTYIEESQGKCFSKAFDRNTTNAPVMQDMDYDYVSVDERPECSSVSNLISSSNFETKCVTDAYDSFENSALTSPIVTNHRSDAEEAFGEHLTSDRLRERQSLDSSITEASSLGRQGYHSQIVNEMSFIRKQLLEIETKQSNLMDLLQVFMGSTMDSLSSLESKVLGLEHTVDGIAQNLVHTSHQSNVVNSKLSKGNKSVSSPRHSISAPRTSLDINSCQLSIMAKHNRGVLGETAFSRSRLSTSEHDTESRKDPRVNIVRNPAVKAMLQSMGRQPQSTSYQARKAGGTISSKAVNAKTKQNISENKNTLWKRVKEFLLTGDLDSAFVEVLCSGDDLTLIELLDRTGPVLERLSHETVSEILSTLALHFLDQRFIGSILPWLQQVVTLSTTYGPDYLVLNAKARMEFLSAIQEAASMSFSNPADRRAVAQLALRLQQVWG